MNPEPTTPASTDGAPGATDAERAAWLADKIVAQGDYAKEAAQMLLRWPTPASSPSDWMAEQLLRVARLIEGMKRECGMDPESPTAIYNGRLMSIAYILRDLAATPSPDARAAGVPTPTAADAAIPGFLRRRLEMAIEDAINPKGMSVHDGKARVHSSDIAYLLKKIDALATAQAAPITPEATAEKYIADMIDRAPEPLRRLGDYLSRVLDEDDFKTAERYVLGAMEAVPITQAVPRMERHVTAEARDAKRYRWLRKSSRLSDDAIDGQIVVATAGGEDILTDEHLDHQIDIWMADEALSTSTPQDGTTKKEAP